ncbi:MAG: wapA, partial [Verrucomicrobiales bacterium]|nr:wapA [Verrucomicrobiales bacterium]
WPLRKGSKMTHSLQSRQDMLGGARRVSGEDCDDSDPAVMPFSGEVRVQTVDLVIPGRGLDFVWARTYRSRTGRTTPMGNRWDHSYNIYCEQIGNAIAVYDGTGRRDLYFPGTNGVYACNEFFNEGSLSNAAFTLSFPDTGKWVFRAFDGSPSSGKISQIMDRNGNAITLYHTVDGQLAAILDTLGRTNYITYNAQGFVQSITDHTGRSVMYGYFDAKSIAGTSGDLATVTSPPVTGTPNGNDFPAGKTTTFSYSRNFADDRENHLLLAITDPKGQTPFQFVYQHNQTDLEFIRCRSAVVGNDTNVVTFSYVPQIPSPANQFATTKCIVNDCVGNVSECFYDSLNRCVRQLDFTGRAVPGVPTTDKANRPTGSLRPEDPAFYETLWSWNIDSLCTRVLYPGQNAEACLYERDFNPGTSPRHKGDLRVLRQVACCADVDRDGFPDLVTRFEYDPRFGSPATAARNPWRGTVSSGAGWSSASSGLRWRVDCEPPTLRSESAKIIMDRDSGRSKGFATRVMDPRGNITTASYDSRGNQLVLNHQGRLLDGSDSAVMNLGYNSFGQLTVTDYPADDQGRRRRDECVYYDSGTEAGYLRHRIADCLALGFHLTNTFEYDSRGNLLRATDPRGFVSDYVVNQLDQVVNVQHDIQLVPRLRVGTATYYDANNNVIQVDTENRDATGALDAINPAWTTLADYDVLDQQRLLAHELTHVVQQGSTKRTFVTNRFEYDGNGNLARQELPEAVNGADPHNVAVYQSDERNLPFRCIRAPGTLDQSVQQWNYTPNALRSVQWEPHKAPGLDLPEQARTIFKYDGFDRCVALTDPMGNVTTRLYDASHNLVYERVDGETNDVPGSAGNLRFQEKRCVYDALGRPISSSLALFDLATGAPLGKGTSLTRFAYAPNGELLSQTDDNGHTTRFTYDSLNRLSSTVDPKTNAVMFSYDAGGTIMNRTSIERPDVAGPEQVFVRSFAYDGFNRCIAEWDNLNNVHAYFFDSRGNRVSEMEPRGNETTCAYDGLGRVTDTTHYNGTKEHGITINTTHVEYRNMRRASATDANGNTTAYGYDSLDRCTSIQQADGTTQTFGFDERGNCVRAIDANGTRIACTFDLLDRCVRKDITPASGVMSSTTFEMFQYDGASRLVLASNNVSMLNFGYDSMGNATKSKQDCIATACEFDGVGNRYTMFLPDGPVIRYDYDALDQVNAISTLDCSGCVNPRVLASYAYEGPGRLGRISRSSGINTRFAWDGLQNPANAAGDFGWRQISGVNHQRAGGAQVIDRRMFAFDPAQNKTQRTQLVPYVSGQPATTNVWEYDALNQLGRAINTKGTGSNFRSYHLDGKGNRLDVTNGVALETYTRDGALPEPADFQMDQYTTTPFGNEQHDPNGNLNIVGTSAGALVHLFDYANRLVEVRRSVGPALLPVATFTYDALGRRISKTVYPPAPSTPVTTQFIYDGLTHSITEERENGALRRSYPMPHVLEKLDRVILQPGGETLYCYLDDLGNALAMTDSKGTVLERYDYDDFGQPSFLTSDGVPMVDSGGLPVNASPLGNPFLFRSMFWDGETGLYQNRRWDNDPYAEDMQRAFSPQTGRYITRAEFQSESCPVSGNAFTFENNNPWSAASRDKLRGTTKTQGDFSIASRLAVEIGHAQVIEYKDGDDPITHKREAKSKDWSNTAEWYKWRKAVLDGKVDRKSMSVIFHNDAGEEASRYNFFEAWPCRWKAPELNSHSRKSISVIFMNDAGEETMRYNFFRAWPRKWTGPALNARNSGHATEKLEISWETMELK